MMQVVHLNYLWYMCLNTWWHVTLLTHCLLMLNKQSQLLNVWLLLCQLCSVSSCSMFTCSLEGSHMCWGYGHLLRQKIWPDLSNHLVFMWHITLSNACKDISALFGFIEEMYYIPHKKLQGTPQEATHWTPLDILTNISLFHLLYYLVWSFHLCCCSHYYIPLHHCTLVTYLKQVEPCLVFY